jgi:hypothetical protein
MRMFYNNKSQKRKISEVLKNATFFLARKQEIHTNEFNIDHSNPIIETQLSVS